MKIFKSRTISNVHLRIGPDHFQGKVLDRQYFGQIINLLDSDFLEQTSPETAVDVRLAVEDVLVTMLNKLQADDDLTLDNSQQQFLLRQLHSDRRLCVLAVLHFISLTHETGTIDWCVEIKKILGSNDSEIARESYRVLSVLQAQADSKTLLRPASVSKQENPNELLRPTIDGYNGRVNLCTKTGENKLDSTHHEKTTSRAS